MWLVILCCLLRNCYSLALIIINYGSLFLLTSLHPNLKNIHCCRDIFSGLLAQLHFWCVRLIVFRVVTPKMHLAFCAWSIIGGTS